MNQREIKFRAWDEEYKRMFVPEAISNDGKAVILFSKYEGRKYDIPVMQYTGLKDKNGTEIYEGDIVEITDGLDKCNYKVEWIEKMCRFGIDGLMVSLYKLINEYDGFVVIGNIYENPELLKAGL